MADKLSVKVRIQVNSTLCTLCEKHNDTLNHLLFVCDYAAKIRRSIVRCLEMCVTIDSPNNWARKLQNLKRSKAKNELVYAGVAAVLYAIWTARNDLTFKK